MLSYRTDKIFRQIDSNLRVQTLASVKHVQILKLLTSQAVNLSVVPAAVCMLAHYIQDIISFVSIYGFDRLQSRITLLFRWFWSLLVVSLFHYAGPLKVFKVECGVMAMDEAKNLSI